MSKSPGLINSHIADLQPGSIPPDWILSGAPKSRSKNLLRSRDWLSHLVVWECTSGCFKWHYSSDEVLIVTSGEAFLLNDQGQEERFGPGDIGYFPAGFSCTWRVPESLRKVAVLRETTLRPVGFCLKVVNKLLRIMGISRKSALVVALVFLGL